MHYSQREWQLLYNQELASDQLDLMEYHLENCEYCRELFLNCIGEDETKQAMQDIGSDFAQRTIEFIKNAKPAESRHISARQKHRRMLINYIAAAAVTIILMGGGVFQSVVDQTAQIPMGSNQRVAHNEDKSLLFTWPSQIEASTSHWVDNMNFTKLKEVKR